MPKHLTNLLDRVCPRGISDTLYFNGQQIYFENWQKCFLGAAGPLTEAINGKRIINPFLRTINEWREPLFLFCVDDYTNLTGEEPEGFVIGCYPKSHTCEFSNYNNTYIFTIDAGKKKSNPIIKLTVKDKTEYPVSRDIATVQTTLDEYKTNPSTRIQHRSEPHETTIYPKWLQKCINVTNLPEYMKREVKRLITNTKEWISPWHPDKQNIQEKYGYKCISDAIIVRDIDMHIGKRFTPKSVRRYYEVIYKLLDFVNYDIAKNNIPVYMIALDASKTKIAYQHWTVFKWLPGYEFIVVVISEPVGRITYAVYLNKQTNIVELKKFETTDDNAQQITKYAPNNHIFLREW